MKKKKENIFLLVMMQYLILKDLVKTVMMNLRLLMSMMMISLTQNDLLRCEHQKRIKLKMNGIGYFLLKQIKHLNTQFKRDNKVQIHPDKGYKEGEILRLSSEYGIVELEVKYNIDLRLDCLLVTNNTLRIEYDYSVDG